MGQGCLVQGAFPAQASYRRFRAAPELYAPGGREPVIGALTIAVTTGVLNIAEQVP
jgi:hypothetical protein